MVELSEKEVIMYDSVMQVLDGHVTPEQAAERAGVHPKTICRKIKIYLLEGTGGLTHRSRGRAAHNRLSQDIREDIIDLYAEKYWGFNFTHFHQKLVEVENFEVSYPTVLHALNDAGFNSPKAHKGKKPKDHPLRARRACAGELVQMDASIHEWVAGCGIWALHLAIDDATSDILAGHFESQETLHGYRQVTAQILEHYGIPEEFFTDRRTVFCSKLTRSSKIEDDATIQFRIMAGKLGVRKIHVSSVPQAKGRVERAFNTLQDRLISEMRIRKISSLKQANAYLSEFIADHNARYGVSPASTTSAFGPKLTQDEINISLAIVNERKVQNGNFVSYKCKPYRAFDEVGSVNLPVGKQVYVLKTLDDKLYVSFGEHLLPLLQMPDARIPTPEEVMDTIYIPPKNHPWKEKSYEMILTKLRKAS